MVETDSSFLKNSAGSGNLEACEQAAAQKHLHFRRNPLTCFNVKIPVSEMLSARPCVCNRFSKVVLAATFVTFILCSSAVSSGDQLQLRLNNVPRHGLVVASVDFTDAARFCGIDSFQPGRIRASVRRGERNEKIPVQFVPGPQYDDRERMSGVLLLQLPDGRDRTVRLKFDHGTSPTRKQDVSRIDTKNSLIRLENGFPSNVELKSGKTVTKSFRWNDRVHHRKTGSFFLRHGVDTVNRISDGPLCTAVRMKGHYSKSNGSRPSSAPTAEYTWYYLKNRPLVYVQTTIRQERPFRWDELHVFEMRFTGSAFDGWTMGDPVRKGSFDGSKESRRGSDWGILLNGSAGFGMFSSGTPLFYDGPGKYGAYLHAHGNKAWKDWSTRKRRFSAWMWIGADERPAREIADASEQTPTSVSARVTTERVRKAVERARETHGDGDNWWRGAVSSALVERGRFEEAVNAAGGERPSGWRTVRAGDFGMALHESVDGLEIGTLFDVEQGRELLGAEPLPIFELVLKDTRSERETTLRADRGWNSVDLSRSEPEGTLKISWDRPAGDRPKNVTARVTVQPDPAGAYQWDISVNNDNDRWSLWRVRFPQLSLARPGSESRLFLPRGPGEVRSDTWRKEKTTESRYPNGWMTMQFMAAYGASGGTGIYAGMHDPHGSTKTMSARGRPSRSSVFLRYDHPVPGMGRRKNSFELPGNGTWKLFRGDWFDAARIYQDWVRKHARWFPELGSRGRRDTPLWMWKLPVWALGGGDPEHTAKTVKRFADYMDLPVGFHWYNWHRIPFDNDYPHYFPAKKGFQKGVEKLQKAGVHVMPYINGRLWDTRDRGTEDRQFSEKALPAAVKNRDGSPATEQYGSKEEDGSPVRLAAMCPSTELWKRKQNEIVRRLVKSIGVDGVYIDQVACAKPQLCFDTDHEHPAGGGHWWMDGYRSMLGDMQDAIPSDRILTTECNADPYLRWFDGYLTWHWQIDGQVPAFPAVYGGAIQMFGRAYRGGPTRERALRMKAGQQLVFGEQIGWIDPGVVKRKESAAFLKKIVRLRWRLRRFFYAGTMERPPEFKEEIPTVRADWRWQGKWPVETDAVLTGAWKKRSRPELVLLFVNVSKSSVTARVQFDHKTYGLKRGRFKVQKITPSGSGGRFTATSTFTRNVTFDPGKVLAFKIRPER